MKKILYLLVACALTAGGVRGYQAYQANSQSVKSELMLRNVEALASSSELIRGERYKCYSSIKREAGSRVILCGVCKPVKDATDSFFTLADYCFY